MKYIITQKALAEGWDCAFAYILVSLAEVKSAKAVEQLLGRILRQPQARQRESDALNRCYAFVVSSHFAETANTLRDCLVKSAGFNHQDAAEYVAARTGDQGRLDLGRGENRVRFNPVEVNLNEDINYKGIPSQTKKKLSWSKKTKKLVITAPLTEEETEHIKEGALMDSTRDAIQEAGEVSRSEKAIQIFQTPSERGERFFVPQMEVYIDGELRLFDEPEAIDYPWDLPVLEAKLSKDLLDALDIGDRIEEGGEIDIDEEKKKLKYTFMKDLTRDLGLSYQPEHWSETKLAAWLCHQVSDPFITHMSKRNFIVAWLSDLMKQKSMDLARVNRQKFLLRNLLEQQVKTLRKEAARIACSQFLFEEGADRVRIGTEYQFEFHPDAYLPSRYDEGQYGDSEFHNHYYPLIGAFDNQEEFYCACWLDRCDGIEFWVRNPVRKNGGSFFIQTPSGRFFPDFICKLKDGRILVVENKGTHLWAASDQDRMVGELWEKQSDGKCLFVMVKEKKWEWIQAKIS